MGDRTDPAAQRARYLRAVARDANILPWAVVNPHFADPDRAERLRLAEVYTRLDTTELRAVRREEELRAFLARADQAERVPAQEAMDRSPRLLILGDPGSGKSTLVKHLAHALATASLAADPVPALAAVEPWRHGALLPVLVELRYLAEYAAGSQAAAGTAALLLAHVQASLAEGGLGDCWPTVQAALDQEQPAVLFLLDGLDEMGGSQRQAVVDAVNDLAERYGQHRCVVTCRPYAYVGQPWRLARFREVTLAPFSREQIDGFVANWYRRLAERLLQLTVMAQLHTFSGRLPDDRTELYADAVRLLLQRWESRMGQAASLLQTLDVPGLKLSDLEAGLYRVTFNAHAAGDAAAGAATADIPEGELRGWLAPYLGGSYDMAGLFVDYIRERAGLLYRHKPAAYTFPHRTFQEFLAACELAGRPDYPGEAARLVQADLNRWGEVFVCRAHPPAEPGHRRGQRALPP